VERELLFEGGRVFTADRAEPWAEALLLSGGTVAAVGPASEVRAAAGPGVRTIRSDGGTVAPAFHDAHAHPLHGGLARLRCYLHELESATAYLDSIAGYARSHPEEPWIQGSGWALEAFGEAGPNRRDLDRVVADRPVLLHDTNIHSAWVNSRALQLAGVSGATPDPRDGRIERDPRGEPTGLLHEGAVNLVEDLAPEASSDELRRALLLAQEYMHSLGIVGWQDAWVTPSLAEPYRELDASGELSARVTACFVWDRHRDASQLADLIELRAGYTKGNVDGGTVKIFLDGVVENGTASMLDPYLDKTGAPTTNSGIDMIPPAALNDYATMLDRAGFQIHFHAIGDAAVRYGLDACERARTVNGPRDARHTIAHVQFVHPRDVGRFAELGVIVNAQPLWAYNDQVITELTLPFVSPSSRSSLYPFGSLARSGAQIAFGSDWPVSSPDPLMGMEVAVTRTDPERRGHPALLPGERLDLDTALTAATMEAAYVCRRDDAGSLTPGKRADLVLLDRDLYRLEGAISDARVLLTLAGGEPVHAVGVTIN
jgi:predicted amidohydrolase YtcJ